MKKYLIGFCAIATAFIAFAFTATDKATYAICNDSVQYVWFSVNPGSGILCSDQGAASVTPAQLDIAGHYTSSPTSTTPLTDLTNDGLYITRPNFIANFNQSCLAVTETYLCAVAYKAADVTNAKFDRVADASSPSGFSWRPKSIAAGGPTPECFICKDNDQD